MNRPVIIAAVLMLLIFFSRTGAYASGFISIGSGGVISGQDSGSNDRFNPGVPVRAGFQYSPDYRDSWMLNSVISYAVFPGNGTPDRIFIFSAGVMYVKPFFRYESNITRTVMKKSGCAGAVLLPFTIMRDTVTDIFQSIIPQHPFAFFDLALIKVPDSDLMYGFSGGAGLTSGNVDLMLKYTRNIGYDNGLVSDIYLLGVEFTLNIPLQDQFVRTAPLIDQ